MLDPQIMDAVVTLTNCNEFPDADDGSKQYIQPTRMISGCPVIGGDDGDGSGSDDPCFGRDSTFACRLSEDVPATAAFDQCFGEAPETTARRVSMSSLRAGDRVLTELDAVPTTTRVLLNEHVVDTSKSAVVTVKHAAGALTLTPDHVLQVDGEWKSAREERTTHPTNLNQPTSQLSPHSRQLCCTQCDPLVRILYLLCPSIIIRTWTGTRWLSSQRQPHSHLDRLWP